MSYPRSRIVRSKISGRVAAVCMVSALPSTVVASSNSARVVS
jgi:hypothetical protein